VSRGISVPTSAGAVAWQAMVWGLAWRPELKGPQTHGQEHWRGSPEMWEKQDFGV
jgi:hypothetical protein